MLRSSDQSWMTCSSCCSIQIKKWCTCRSRLSKSSRGSTRQLSRSWPPKSHQSCCTFLKKITRKAISELSWQISSSSGASTPNAEKSSLQTSCHSWCKSSSNTTAQRQTKTTRTNNSRWVTAQARARISQALLSTRAMKNWSSRSLKRLWVSWTLQSSCTFLNSSVFFSKTLRPTLKNSSLLFSRCSQTYWHLWGNLTICFCCCMAQLLSRILCFVGILKYLRLCKLRKSLKLWRSCCSRQPTNKQPFVLATWLFRFSTRFSQISTLQYCFVLFRKFTNAECHQLCNLLYLFMQDLYKQIQKKSWSYCQKLQSTTE